MLPTLLLAILPTGALQQALAPEWLGCWRATDGSNHVLRFEEQRASWLRDGKPSFYRLHATESAVFLEVWSNLIELQVHSHGDGGLHVEGAGVDLELERCAVPAQLRIDPYEWPTGIEVDADMVSMLAADLAVRHEEDQRVRRGGASSDQIGEMARVDADNIAFLQGVVEELGWIDAQRFGSEASNTAFLIVQHCDDLRFMKTALPFIEADVRAGRLGGGNYALLYDRLQLNLGYPQRYGSQIGGSPELGSVLMPCEDIALVNERRAELGMSSLAEYLDLFRASPDAPRPAYLPDVLRERLYPRAWVPLFNGRDLEGWRVKIAGHELDDNYAETFRVEDGLLRVTYEDYDDFGGRFGHLVYQTPFSHYRLRVEYRFVGDACPGGPAWGVRNSGVMLHGQAPESMTRDQAFPVSLEAQMLGGDGTNDRSTANLCTPGTDVSMNGETVQGHCTSSTSGTYHGDEWVTLEVEVHGSELFEHFMDGQRVLQYTQARLDGDDPDAARLLANGASPELSSGYLSLQAESHPIEFRRVEIQELD